jgi:phosphate transport system protein
LTDTPHTSTEYEQQLALVHDRVLQMGARVERQVADAIESLASGSQALIGQILRHEALVNALEIEVDALVGQIIARRQPTARDLRMLMAVIKATTHLERVGDEAKKIALQAQRLFSEGRPMLPRYVEIRRISQMVLAMLRTSLAALEGMEVGGAGGVADRDLAVDDAFLAVLRQLITYMIEDPRTITAALDILFIAKSLERIGDHAKNIAEQVIYAVEGRDVRHAADPAR